MSYALPFLAIAVLINAYMLIALCVEVRSLREKVRIMALEILELRAELIKPPEERKPLSRVPYFKGVEKNAPQRAIEP